MKHTSVVRIDVSIRKLAIAAVSVGLLLSVTTVASTPAAASVETGWSFEDGTTGGWSAWFGGGSVSAVASGGRTGPGALRADSNATGQTSEVNSGQRYDVSAYMKTLAPAKTRGGEVQVYDTANNAVTLPLLFTNDLNGWTKASARITLPAQTRVVVLGFDAGGASFLLDDVTLRPVDPLVPDATTPTLAPVTKTTPTSKPRHAATRRKPTQTKRKRV